MIKGLVLDCAEKSSLMTQDELGREIIEIVAALRNGDVVRDINPARAERLMSELRRIRPSTRVITIGGKSIIFDIAQRDKLLLELDSERIAARAIVHEYERVMHQMRFFMD